MLRPIRGVLINNYFSLENTSPEQKEIKKLKKCSRFRSTHNDTYTVSSPVAVYGLRHGNLSFAETRHNVYIMFSYIQKIYVPTRNI